MKTITGMFASDAHHGYYSQSNIMKARFFLDLPNCTFRFANFHFENQIYPIQTVFSLIPNTVPFDLHFSSLTFKFIQLDIISIYKGSNDPHFNP